VKALGNLRLSRIVLPACGKMAHRAGALNSQLTRHDAKLPGAESLVAKPKRFHFPVIDFAAENMNLRHNG
jgi:hypothetical protein